MQFLYSENEPENQPENEPENQPENGPEMYLGKKKVFCSKFYFIINSSEQNVFKTLKSVFKMTLIAKRVNLCL